MRRTYLLAILAACCLGSEAETLVMQDGRRLTGIYDEATHILDMGSAKLVIQPGDIARRARPSQAELDGMTAKPRQGGDWLDEDDPKSCLAEYGRRLVEADRMKAEAVDKLNQRLLAIMKRLDLRCVKYQAPPDPKAADQDLAKRIEALNAALTAAWTTVDAAAVAEFEKKQPKGVLKMVGITPEEVPTLTQQAISIFTDPETAALFATTRKGFVLVDNVSRVGAIKAQIQNGLRSHFGSGGPPGPAPAPAPAAGGSGVPLGQSVRVH